MEGNDVLWDIPKWSQYVSVLVSIWESVFIFPDVTIKANK